MKRLCKNLYRREKGFTLVELMIVIIILAILTGIAIPSYMVLRDRARTAAAQSELKNIATAVEMYNADNDEYPATGFDNLVTALTTPPAGASTSEPYMDPVPDTDPWGTPYVYALVAGTYTLESYGPDEADGGDDDIELVNGQLQ